MICPKCSTQNGDGTRFCVRCGADMMTTQSRFSMDSNIQIESQSSSAFSNVSQTSNNVSSFNSETTSNNYSSNEFQKNNSNLKKIIAIVLILLIVIGGVFFLFKKLGHHSSIKIFDPNQPIIIKKDNKYGYINTKGKVIIEPTYEYATSFIGDYAVVKANVKQDGKEESLYQVIDKKGAVKAIASSYEGSIQYVPEYDIWIIKQQLYDGSLKKITDDNTLVTYKSGGYLSWINAEKKTGGIMKPSGKVTYSYKLHDEETVISIIPSETDASLKKTYCQVAVDSKKYAIVNCDTGKMIYNFTDKYISVEDDNIFSIQTNMFYGRISTMYIQNDKVAYQASSEDVDLSYNSAGYIEIRDDSKDYDNWYSYYDIKKKQVVNTRPSSSSNNLSEFEKLTGLKEFSCNTGTGLLKGNKVVLPGEWDDIDFFGDLLYQYLKSKGKNYILTEKDSKTYIVNLKNKKTVTEFNSSYIYDNDSSTFIYYTDSETSETVIYNLLTGKRYSTSSNNSLKVYSNYITITENNKTNYYNVDLKLIYTEEN